LSTINRTKLSIAIVGRPSLKTSRPVSTNSERQRSTIGHNNSSSLNSTSIRARSSGNPSASTGNTTSHKHSDCSARSVNISSPFDQKPAHMQDILTDTPDGTPSSRG
jgi:hypothetical protein